MDKNLSTQFNEFFILMKEASLQEFLSHSAINKNISLNENLSNYLTPPVYDNYMSIIMLGSKDFKIVLKTFFNLDLTEKFLKKHPANSDKFFKRKIIFDFMKEYSNLTAGHIKRYFEDLGISIPLISRAFDDVYLASDKSYQNHIKFLWKIQTPFGNVVFKAELSIQNKDILANYKYVPKTDDSVEFF